MENEAHCFGLPFGVVLYGYCMISYMDNGLCFNDHCGGHWDIPFKSIQTVARSFGA